MGDLWGILGIEATADEALIRKAYAARLRDNNPDSNPAGFQTLRAAYEAALSRARRGQRRLQSPPQVLEVAEPAEQEAQDSAPREVRPPTQDEQERAELFARIGGAVTGRNLPEALKLYDSGLASGILEFRTREYVLNQIMALAVDDKSLNSRQFIALLEHVGWQSLPGRGDFYNPLRQRAVERGEAEIWSMNVERVADGENKKQEKRSFSPFVLLARWRAAHDERQAARLLLGRWQIPRFKRGRINAIRRLMLQFEHYRKWIEHRFDARNIAYVERLLRWDDKIFSKVRRAGGPGFALVIGVVLAVFAVVSIAVVPQATVFSGIVAFRLIRYGMRRLAWE